jgi:hypothetical protein
MRPGAVTESRGVRPPGGKDSGRAVPWYLHAALFFLLVCINTLVARFAVFSFPYAPGASSLYIVVALMIVFTLWFGMYGALAAYAGCYLGAGILSGIPPDVALYWSLADLWQVLIPLVAFRVLKADPALGGWRDLGVLLLTCVVVNNLIGAIWGSATLAIGGVIPWSSVSGAGIGWLAGNVLVSLVLVPPLLRFGTPRLQLHELYIRRYWQ